MAPLVAFVQGAEIGMTVKELPVVDGRYAGRVLDCFMPFPILWGIGLMLGYAMFGAAWLMLKTEGELHDWAYRRLP